MRPVRSLYILGQFATAEQIQLLREQMGLNQPLYVHYLDWLIGNLIAELQKDFDTAIMYISLSERQRAEHLLRQARRSRCCIRRIGRCPGDKLPHDVPGTFDVGARRDVGLHGRSRSVERHSTRRPSGIRSTLNSLFVGRTTQERSNFALDSTG